MLTESLDADLRLSSLEVLPVDPGLESVEPHAQSEEETTDAVILYLVGGMVALGEVDKRP